MNMRRIDSKLDLGVDGLSCSLNNVRLDQKAPSLPSSVSFECLPPELHLAVFRHVPDVADLLTLRAVSRYTRTLANVVLSQRISSQLPLLRSESARFSDAHESVESANGPAIEHFRAFLRRASGSWLHEVARYPNPAPEVQTVCACLCLLLGVDTTATANYNGPYAAADVPLNERGQPLPHYARVNANGDLHWGDIRRAMSQPQFRSWFAGLANNAQEIPLAYAEYVERLIASDPDISYERLEGVSDVGHSLLVMVAASLQIARLAVPVREARLARSASSERLGSYERFSSLVSSSASLSDC